MSLHTPQRKRLPASRAGITHKGMACGFEFYVTVNCYPDDPGRIAEMFVTLGKEGSDIGGWVRAWATSVSIALQYGVPWEVIRDKALHMRFGVSDDQAPSLLHAIAQAVDDLLTEEAAKGGQVGGLSVPTGDPAGDAGHRHPDRSTDHDPGRRDDRGPAD